VSGIKEDGFEKRQVLEQVLKTSRSEWVSSMYRPVAYHQPIQEHISDENEEKSTYGQTCSSGLF
jgi:hypothetical protein